MKLLKRLSGWLRRVREAAVGFGAHRGKPATQRFQQAPAQQPAGGVV